MSFRVVCVLVASLGALLVSPRAFAMQLDPPIITPQGTTRLFEVTSLTEAEDEDTSDFVRKSINTNGPWIQSATTSSVGAKGSTSSGMGRYESNVAAFKIRAEGEATATASTGDPEGTSTQINTFTLQMQFTVPSSATFALRGTFEASGSGPAGTFGQEGGQAAISLTVQGLGANGLPWIQMHQIDQSASEPYEFVAAQPVQANSPITLLFSASCRSGNTSPASAESALSFEFELDFGDDDNDGLLNVWEEDGIDIDGDGIPEIDLPAMGADPQHKNLFVELDAMSGVPVDLQAITMVEAAFLEAPNEFINNPNGQDGVILFFMVDESDLPNTEYDDTSNWPPQFDTAKSTHYGTPDLREDAEQWDQLKEVYKYIFRYCIWGDKIFYNKPEPQGTKKSYFSGKAELPGDDFFVAASVLRGWYTDSALQTQALAGTLMHELGHNLNLSHGGDDEINNKPHYLSVMNYAYQYPIQRTAVDGRSVSDLWYLDFSRQSLGRLNETDLNEQQGVGGPPGRFIYFNISGNGVSPQFQIIDADAPQIDWNFSGPPEPIEEQNATVDLNRHEGTTDFYNTNLQSSIDWDRLWYHLFGSTDFADGAHTSAATIERFETEDFDRRNAATYYDTTTNPCPADLNGDGILDLGDINTFVNLFLASDLAADLNSDGILDLGDINSFVAAFLEGC